MELPEEIFKRIRGAIPSEDIEDNSETFFLKNTQIIPGKKCVKSYWNQRKESHKHYTIIPEEISSRDNLFREFMRKPCRSS